MFFIFSYFGINQLPLSIWNKHVHMLGLAMVYGKNMVYVKNMRICYLLELFLEGIAAYAF